MDKYYSVNVFNRTLSLVVLPIDGFTGNPAKGKKIEVIIKELNKIAVAKNDGYHVFSDLPKGNWSLWVKSEEFFDEKITISVGKEAINVTLIPCAGYKLPSGCTFVDSDFFENAMAWFIPIGEAPFAKLKSIDKDTVAFRMKPPRNLAKLTVAFCLDNEIEMFELGDCIANNTYKHNLKLTKEYKPGVELFLVTTGKSDSNGRLFCPLKGFSSRHKSVLMRYEHDGRTYNELFAISYGRGNNLLIGTGKQK